MPKPPKGYRRVTVVLYISEAVEADRLVDILKAAGWPKANRSLLMREALLHWKTTCWGDSRTMSSAISPSGSHGPSRGNACRGGHLLGDCTKVMARIN